MSYDELKALALEELPQHICRCRRCGCKVLLSSGSRLLTNLCWTCGIKEVPLGTRAGDWTYWLAFQDFKNWCLWRTF